MKLYRYLTGVDDDSFCHRVTAELNKGWQFYGQPTLTYDQERTRVICGQVITRKRRANTGRASSFRSIER